MQHEMDFKERGETDQVLVRKKKILFTYMHYAEVQRADWWAKHLIYSSAEGNANIFLTLTVCVYSLLYQHHLVVSLLSGSD